MDENANGCLVLNEACTEPGGSAELFINMYTLAPWGSIAIGAVITMAIFTLARFFYLWRDGMKPVPVADQAQEPV